MSSTNGAATAPILKAELGENAVLARIPLGAGDNVLVIMAVNIRNEHTGAHAQVAVGINSTILAYDTFNVGRDGDRTRLANSAFNHLGEVLKVLLSKNVLKHYLDLFSIQIWPTAQSAMIPPNGLQGVVVVFRRTYLHVRIPTTEGQQTAHDQSSIL